jgi:hypothetical protein
MVKDKLSGAMVGNVSPDALGLRDGLVDLAAAAAGEPKTPSRFPTTAASSRDHDNSFSQ